MYETLEHWKEYQYKKLQKQELDKLLTKLSKKNGVTKL